ncbi:hypothetical protein HJC99_04690 [Candidatus Saccharibacteria bacterium]|nr:hypothetical protein [Candidatus Saccharibacteria bacterium]
MSTQQEVSRLTGPALMARELLKLDPVIKVWAITNPNFGHPETAMLVSVRDRLVDEYFKRLALPWAHRHRRTRYNDLTSDRYWVEDRQTITWDLLGTSFEAFLVRAFCQIEPANLATMQELAGVMQRDSGNHNMSIILAPNNWLDCVSVLTEKLYRLGVDSITDPLEPETFNLAALTYARFNPDTASFEDHE